MYIQQPCTNYRIYYFKILKYRKELNYNININLYREDSCYKYFHLRLPLLNMCDISYKAIYCSNYKGL